MIGSSAPRTTSAHAMSCVADIGGSPASAAPTCTARQSAVGGRTAVSAVTKPPISPTASP
eukprot:scaffold38648_cov39-Phaeocystis_antarctica.AAC.1